MPEEFTLEEIKAVVSDRPPNVGQMLLNEKGNPLKIAIDVNKEVFYEYVLNQLKTNVSLHPEIAMKA